MGAWSGTDLFPLLFEGEEWVEMFLFELEELLIVFGLGTQLLPVAKINMRKPATKIFRQILFR